MPGKACQKMMPNGHRKELLKRCPTGILSLHQSGVIKIKVIFFSRRIACKIKVMPNGHFIPTAGKACQKVIPGRACQKVIPGKACQKVMPNGHRKEFLGQFSLSQLFKYFRYVEMLQRMFSGEYQFSILHTHGCNNSIYPTSNWVHY